MGTKEVENGKACAALSYVLFGIIWYFADEKMRSNRFAKYHSKQGLVLLIVWLIASVVLTIISRIPFLGWLLWTVVMLALVALLILGIINAVNGHEKELPVIGQFAKGFTY